jgi:hypothetical protein
MTTPASGATDQIALLTFFTGSVVRNGLRDIYPGGSTVQTALPCPDCDVPAEITERFSLPSTDGAVDHVVVRCAVGHCFRMAADRLPSRQRQELATRNPAA